MKITPQSSAIVTGGASGLGEATARRLRAAGAQVTLFDMNETRAADVAAEIGATFEIVDVSDAASAKKAIADVAARTGGLHILVNCAGIGPAAKTTSRGEAHDPELFAKVIGVNLMGSFFCASEAATHMVKNDPLTEDGARGVIVNTASVAAFDGQIGQVAYSASKGGIAGMTLPMARDLSAYGVRVCTIAPGLFLTPLLEGLPEEVQNSLGAQVPFPARLGKPAEYAQMVEHIVENDMLNGETIRLDGAIRMAPR